MSTRAIADLTHALIKEYTVKSGTTTTVGGRVKFGASDTEIDNAGAADDLAIGTCQEAKTGDAGGTQKVSVVLDFSIIVPMVVGTGGSTRGTKQKTVSNGVTDIAAGGVTNNIATVGVAMQTGVVGDLIGVGINNSRVTTA